MEGADQMSLGNEGVRLGAWVGRWVTKSTITGLVVCGLMWGLKDRVPDAVLFFILGAVFNDMWNAYPKEEEE